MKQPSVTVHVTRYDIFILAVSAVSIIVFALDSLFAFVPEVHRILGGIDTFLCVLFFFDFLIRLNNAPTKSRYLMRGGWFDLVSSIPDIGVLRLGRIVRITRILRLLRGVRSIRTVTAVLKKHPRANALSLTLFVSTMTLLFGCVAVLQFEHVPGSNIETAGDALWWAFATITTVGYGDLYPITLEGRLTAVVLMGVGVSIFGVLSGLCATWLLHHSEEESSYDQLVTELNSVKLALDELKVLVGLSKRDGTNGD